MSSFTQPLIVRKLKARTWQVERAFKYHIGSEDSNEIVAVPKGFTTDFASVPRIFWVIIPPDGNYTQACVLHDYTYFAKLFKRKKCDYIFYEAMGVLKVPKWKRWTMWKAVSWFAGRAWKMHRRREK